MKIRLNDTQFAAIALIVMLVFLGWLPYITRDIYNYFNADRPIVFLKDRIENKQLDAYSRGYKAGYDQAMTDVEEQKFLDGGVE